MSAVTTTKPSAAARARISIRFVTWVFKPCEPGRRAPQERDSDLL
jgi:hypothetical protein